MKKILVFLIRFYQKKISPKKKPVCRFRPTCSQFAIEAVEKHGVFLGSVMAFFRLLRCNPLFKGGYDPVPEHFSLRSSVGRVSKSSVCEKCSVKENCDRQSCEALPETKIKE